LIRTATTVELSGAADPAGDTLDEKLRTLGRAIEWSARRARHNGHAGAVRPTMPGVRIVSWFGEHHGLAVAAK
jgi:hypothetical protein